MLLEIHMLQNHAPANLNRDDTGSPKDCVFGGVTRGRISSQCLKRNIRISPIFKEEMKGIDLGKRTRQLPQLVKEKLLKMGVAEDLASEGAKLVSNFGRKRGSSDGEKTAQIMFFSPADIERIAGVVKESIDAAGTVEKFKKVKPQDLEKDANSAGMSPITPDIALFGRMITTDAFHNVEAAMQVAHALSTNKVVREFDHFTAVDDETQNQEESDEKGAGMIGDLEFNSSCYYKYFSLDTEGFLDNLLGNGVKDFTGTLDETAAKAVLQQTVKAFLSAAVFTSPSGKQNTFAAHQPPSAIFIEAKPRKIPISYANAFVQPVTPRGNEDLVLATINRFIAHVNKLTSKYSVETTKRLWFTTRDDDLQAEIEGATTCTDDKALLAEVAKILA